MKYTITTAILFLVTTLIWSQDVKNEPISGKVTYEYITNLKGIPLPRKATLYFNEVQSLFIHGVGAGPVVIDFTGKKVSPDTVITTTGQNTALVVDAYVTDSIGNRYFKDFSRNTLIFREVVLYKWYLVEESGIPTIKWNISQETKRFGKLLCQKATGDFRGRTYTAWFCNDIPISDGPWKLQGLPGMILEAYDETGEVKFLFHSVSIPDDNARMIKPPSQGEKISLEAFSQVNTELLKEWVRRQTANKDRDNPTEYSIGKVNLIEKNFDK